MVVRREYTNYDVFVCLYVVHMYVTDVVIMSFQLLHNINYFRLGSGEEGGAIKMGDERYRLRWIRSYLKVQLIIMFPGAPQNCH